ncbi:Adenylate kinase 1 chloroplastic [Bienertia sinuspersici]
MEQANHETMRVDFIEQVTIEFPEHLRLPPNKINNLKFISHFNSINILSRNFTSLTSETTLHSRHSWNDSSNNKPLTLRTEPKGRNVHWVFLGCPGVGKGTYATRLSKLLNVPHIATGDLVRDELASAGPLSPQIAEIVNKGKLVSDEIIIDLLSKRLEAGEAKESGFILDGFPRTVRQAFEKDTYLPFERSSDEVFVADQNN